MNPACSLNHSLSLVQDFMRYVLPNPGRIRSPFLFCFPAVLPSRYAAAMFLGLMSYPHA